MSFWNLFSNSCEMAYIPNEKFSTEGKYLIDENRV